MAYIRQEVRGTTGQDIAKINDNFMGIYEKVFGDINFSDTDTTLQNTILTQYIPFQGEGNLDNKYPLTIRFYVPPNVKTIKNASLNVFLENYRMDSDITEGGGGVAGGSVSLSVAKGGGYTNSLGAEQKTSYVKGWGGQAVSVPYTTFQYLNSSNWGKIYVSDYSTGATYGFHTDPNGGMLIPLFFASDISSFGELSGVSAKAGLDVYYLQHTHTIPSHSHSISIEPHTHAGNASITIDDHKHQLKEGIRVSTETPLTTIVSINDNNVCSISGANATKNNVDITSYIKIGEWNIIKVSTENLARVSVYGTIEALMKLNK